MVKFIKCSLALQLFKPFCNLQLNKVGEIMTAKYGYLILPGTFTEKVALDIYFSPNQTGEARNGFPWYIFCYNFLVTHPNFIKFGDEIWWLFIKFI